MINLILNLQLNLERKQLLNNNYKDSDIYTSIPISELPEGSEIAGNPNKPEIA